MNTFSRAGEFPSVRFTGSFDLLGISLLIFTFLGEMFDLEELAAMCKELNRWTFFVSSVPLNMPGGVSSPPNAMAIF